MTTTNGVDLRARRSEIVDEHIDAENRHDPAAVVATFHEPRYDLPSFGVAGQVEGAQAVHDMWADILAAFPDLHIEAGPHLHSDEAVFVEVTLQGTQRADWAGIPATGRSMSVRIACLYEFDGDRLIGERGYFDFATIMRQLGALD